MLVPVDTVPVTVPYCMPEMKVEVQDIEAVIPSQCGTVEVPFNHIPPQRGCQWLELRESAASKSHRMKQGGEKGSSIYQSTVPSPILICWVTCLRQKETPSDTLPQGHRHVPHQQAGVWQNLIHAYKYPLQVLSVALH